MSPAERVRADAALAVRHLSAVWTLESLVDGGDGQRLLDRGAELFAFEDAPEHRIREVRAYYAERGGDLRGFDHAGRGHATLS